MNDESRNRPGTEAEHWKRIDQLLEQALEVQAGERASFLEKACVGDAKLRSEVEELLAAHDRAGNFLASPAVEVAAKEMAKDKAGSPAGRRLGPYEVQSLLGAGGMGEVYRARDTRLDRTVALKILPPEFASDEERMRRFRREAKAASALNHPNVATIYDIGDSDGIHYIAMEHVEGRTLDALIGRKGMRLNEVLKYGVQIADGLVAAHEAGVVHRDLKPGNLMVTAKGQVKVLDFGLAKLRERVSFSHDGSTAATRPTTEEGRIVGTVAYMSPEQAEGKPVDTRSDIFSFGSVLYEMVTGRRAFQGDTPSSTLASILKENPRPASEVVKTLPKEVERLISRCLRKDVAHRFQHMDDVKIMLEELKEESDSGALEEAGIPEVAVHGRLWWGAVLAGMSVIVVALGIAGWFWLGRSRPAAEEGALMAVPLTTYPGTEDSPSFSLDGTQVAFQWCTGEPGTNCHIYIKQIDVEPPQQLTNNPAEDSNPAWSPDGRTIAFLRKLSPTRHALMLIPQRGGEEHMVGESDRFQGETPVPYLAWTPDSKGLVLPWAEPGKAGGGLYLISVETEEKRKLTDNRGDASPAFSPDGRTLAFARPRASGYGSGLYFLRLGQYWELQGEPERVALGKGYCFGAAWMPDGSEIVLSLGDYENSGRRSMLWRMAASSSGKPRNLAFATGNPSSPTISRQGNRLAYMTEASDNNIWRVDVRDLTQEPAAPVQLISSTRQDKHPAYSRDGSKIAFWSDRSGAWEIWVCDSDGSKPVQLTSSGGSADWPRWSPDGKRIVFTAEWKGNQGVYVISAKGGVPQRLTTDPAIKKWPYWSWDGQSVYFTSLRGGEQEIWKMPATGGDAVQITRNTGDVPQESPDGKFVYFQKGWPLRCSVWKVPVVGGEETVVLDSVHCAGQWTVWERGIYFFRPPDEKGRSDICLYEFATGTTRKMLTIERRIGAYIASSADGRTILYTQFDQAGSDLMLVENFR